MDVSLTIYINLVLIDMKNIFFTQTINLTDLIDETKRISRFDEKNRISLTDKMGRDKF